MTKRKTYSEEFKREAVRRLESRGERPAREIAEGLCVAENQLYGWRKRLGQVSAAQSASYGTGNLEEEVQRLRRKLATVTRERDLLKRTFDLIVRETH